MYTTHIILVTSLSTKCVHTLTCSRTMLGFFCCYCYFCCLYLHHRITPISTIFLGYFLSIKIYLIKQLKIITTHFNTTFNAIEFVVLCSTVMYFVTQWVSKCGMQ